MTADTQIQERTSQFALKVWPSISPSTPVESARPRVWAAQTGDDGSKRQGGHKVGWVER